MSWGRKYFPSLMSSLQYKIKTNPNVLVHSKPWSFKTSHYVAEKVQEIKKTHSSFLFTINPGHSRPHITLWKKYKIKKKKKNQF